MKLISARKNSVRSFSTSTDVLFNNAVKMYHLFGIRENRSSSAYVNILLISINELLVTHDMGEVTSVKGAA